MNQFTPTGDKFQGSGNSNQLSNPAITPSVDAAAASAHRAVDKIADKATVQVDSLSGSVHNAVNAAADGTGAALDWASRIPDQAKQIQVRATDAASASIRARPLATVGGALAIGYLLGRIARL